MASDSSPTHEHLLTLAHKVKAAVEDRDVQRLRPAAWRFFDGLVEHLDGEAPVLLRSAPPEARLLRRGQVRLVGTASDLLRNTESSAEECDCEELANLLIAELSLQAADERRCLPSGCGDAGCARCRRGARWSSVCNAG